MSIHSTSQKKHRFMILAFLFSLVFCSFMMISTIPKVQASGMGIMHVGESWIGTYVTNGTNHSTRTLKITSMSSTLPASFTGIIDNIYPTQGVLGSLANMQALYSWNPAVMQNLIHRWGLSPLDYYIDYSIPWLEESGQAVFGQSHQLSGLFGNISGNKGEFVLNKVIPRPTTKWIAPTKNGVSVIIGKSYTFQAAAYPSKSGNPAIDHVTFTGFLPRYHEPIALCANVTAHTAQNVYSCTPNFNTINGGNPVAEGLMNVTFSVADKWGNVIASPNGWISGKLVYSTNAKVDKAIAWAMSQQGQHQWDGNCEVFVELAYGKTFHYGTAQENEQAKGTQTKGTPDIGALVFFKYVDKTGAVLGHVGIYLGGNLFISDTQTSYGVHIFDINYWAGYSSSPYEGWRDAP